MTHTLIGQFQKKYQKKNVPQLRPGMIVRVEQRIKEGSKERTQAFEGVIIKLHNKKNVGATFTVRKVVGGIGVEKIFPLHGTTVEKITVLRSSRVRRAKLYYLRERSGKSAKLKEGKLKDLGDYVLAEEVDEVEDVLEAPVEETTEATGTEEVVETVKEEEATAEATPETPEEEKKDA